MSPLAHAVIEAYFGTNLTLAFLFCVIEFTNLRGDDSDFTPAGRIVFPIFLALFGTPLFLLAGLVWLLDEL